MSVVEEEREILGEIGREGKDGSWMGWEGRRDARRAGSVPTSIIYPYVCCKADEFVWWLVVSAREAVSWYVVQARGARGLCFLLYGGR